MEVAPLAVIVAVGFVTEVTVIGVVLIAHPFAAVIVAEQVPEVVTLIACEVAPFDHKYVAPVAAEVKVTNPPLQKVVAPDVLTVEDGDAFTVTTVAAEAIEHPPDCVTVTTYDPVVPTFIDCVVAPVDHKYETPVLAESVTVLPAQNIVAPAVVIVAVGADKAVTVIGDVVAVHPEVDVIVAE